MIVLAVRYEKVLRSITGHRWRAKLMDAEALVVRKYLICSRSTIEPHAHDSLQNIPEKISIKSSRSFPSR